MTEARRDVIVSLVPPNGHVIDVGADHGYIAARLGAIATERMPHRAGTATRRWVICDGLRAFRKVQTAIIAGMGARTIQAILARGPRPETLIAHAQDDPPALRAYLAANGWRIDAEALAPEARGHAQVIRAVAGVEDATGHTLHFGPRLLEGEDPYLRAYLVAERDRWTQIAQSTAGKSPMRHDLAVARAAFLHGIGAGRGWWNSGSVRTV